MPNIYLCFVWHMHQPFYKDLLSGEFKLPWTRMHALKDYYGMVQVLDQFPEIHQTFNLVPSLLLQLEEYASGRAADPFYRMALKPAEQFGDEDVAFVLRYFFQANAARMIYRYPRYGELFDAWHAADRNPRRARFYFNAQALRDLQVLSQLAWFDEEFLAADPLVREMVEQGRQYTLEQQQALGRKQIELTGKVIPVYQEFAARGQIEISTTPYYHPILPLLCDTQIAEVSHPYVPLPPRFRYPEDARVQLFRAREFMQARLGAAPAGLWPSEGSVSDDALALAAEAGFRWFATDNGVLARTLNTPATPEVTYRPYVWRQSGRELSCIFRDHYLSDLIGFVYSRMDAAEAAAHFLERIRANSAALLRQGRDVLVPIVLDGENAWEYYELSGRPFLRELYRRIQDSKDLHALTVSEALRKIDPTPLDGIFPASWINANFDIWIGAEEDNRAWELLLRARQAYDQVLASPAGAQLPADRKALAYEELLIAEGSDWCWWYGPEHDSANRPDFDQIFRDHLANVYRALNLPPPDELSRPILRLETKAVHESPSGPVRAIVDGEITSYFEWLGAGLYRVDDRSGAMHGQRFLVRELRYGSDGQSLYLRLDFEAAAGLGGRDLVVRVTLQRTGHPAAPYQVHLGGNGSQPRLEPPPGTPPPAYEIAFGKVLELRLSLAGYDLADTRFQVSLWQGGLPLDAIPQQGWLDVSTAEQADWLI